MDATDIGTVVIDALSNGKGGGTGTMPTDVFSGSQPSERDGQIADAGPRRGRTDSRTDDYAMDDYSSILRVEAIYR